LNQVFPDFEIIVSDGSGTAATREIVANFGDGGRVKYLSNPTTLRVAKSWVRVVDEARGRCIAILNGGHIWEREMLAELVQPLETDTEFDRAKEARSHLWQSFLLQHSPRVMIHAAATFLPRFIRNLLKTWGRAGEKPVALRRRTKVHLLPATQTLTLGAFKETV